MQADTYDIVLMDLQMPEMNRFEVTEYIRKTMDSKVPIISLTAEVTRVEVEKCAAVEWTITYQNPWMNIFCMRK